MKDKPGIMAHLVADYPDRESFLAAARGLKDGGADILELQIPFSDPTADGPVITSANEQVVSQGFRIKHIFPVLKQLKNIGFQRIIVMTYSNIVFRYGIKRFMLDLKKAGVFDLIVPDFPLEDDEGFYLIARELSVNAIPVAVTNMKQERIKMLKRHQSIYVSLRVGTTGQKTVISNSSKNLLKLLSGKEIFAGFGIQSPEQVKALSGLADFAVVGSFFTRTIAQATSKKHIYTNIKTAVSRLKS